MENGKKFANIGSMAETLENSIKGKNYITAAFSLENLSGDFNKEPLYAGLALALAKEYDSMMKSEELSKDGKYLDLLNQMIEYNKNKAPSYFKRT